MKTSTHVDKPSTAALEVEQQAKLHEKACLLFVVCSTLALLQIACASSQSYTPNADRSRAHRRQATEERVVSNMEAQPSAGETVSAEVAGPNREGYNEVVDNPFHLVADAPLSTFSVDVDTASYANVRRMLRHGQKPLQSAVRIEEFINYFTYAYENPKEIHPISVHTEVADAPWAPQHRLVKVGVKARSLDVRQRPASNLVFLIDASGSMSSSQKLPLLKKGLRKLLHQLDERDLVSIVAYAGAAGLVLPPTAANDDDKILDSLDNVRAGGSTNGGQGIQLAYAVAQQNFIEGGTNRVLLATDGDFNVGVSSQGELINLVEKKAQSGIFLSILGLGMGNFQDGTLELLSNKGNGNYAYIDTEREAQKVLVDELSATLVTRAKDVKLQVEFNPAQVSSYRLIGYANRLLADEDFNDDNKDAGDMGAGHTVTALYEIVLRENAEGDGVGDVKKVDLLRYQTERKETKAAASDELFTLKVRYKEPDEGKSELLSFTCFDEGFAFNEASVDFRFAASVASFGMLLRESKYKGSSSFEQVRTLAKGSLGEDEHGYRSEFLELVEQAAQL